MNRLRLWVLCFLSSVAAASAQKAEPAAPGFYAEAALGYAILSDYDYVFGPEVAFGYRMDAANHLLVQTGYYQTTAKVFSDDVRLTPLLVSFRRITQLSPKWTGSLAVVGGAVFQRYEDDRWIFPRLGGGDREEKSETAGALGGELGVDYHVNDHVSIGLSASVLALTSTDIVTSNALGLLRFRVGFVF